jgi:hypothetical protein
MWVMTGMVATPDSGNTGDVTGCKSGLFNIG